MNFNFRKILVIGIAVLAFLVIFLGVRALFFGGQDTGDTGKNTGDTRDTGDIRDTGDTGDTGVKRDTGGGSTTVSLNQNIQNIQQREKIKALSDRPVIGIGLNREGDRIVYYDKETGQVFRISFDGKIWERISDVQIQSITKVTWAPTRDKVIIEQTFRQGSGQASAIKYVYDYNAGKKYNLDSHIKKIVWSPDGQKILYHYWDPQNQSNVAIANFDGSHWFSVTPSEMSGLDFAWPKQDTATFIAPEGSFYGATLYYMKIAPPYSLIKMIDNKYGFSVNWSPKGNKMIYSVKEDKDATNAELYLRDLDKETETNLSINALPEHCVWSVSENSVYCAEATQNFLGILPQDYQKKLSLGGDSFWKIDLEARQIKEIYIPKTGEQIYDTTEMIASPLEDFIFFVNKLDGKLYSLSL